MNFSMDTLAYYLGFVTTDVIYTITFFAILYLLILLFRTYYKSSKKVKESLTWLRAKGEILNSHATKKHTTEDSYYEAEIQYKYSIGSRIFKNNTICAGDIWWYGFSQKAEYYCKKYPVGKLVDVYDNPDYPQDSCLEREKDFSPIY